ncbi:MAG: Crossover junction endodeoxyribonuclease RuvC [Planctomycetes bacterium ADurb.Bin412]|nr:MAG: Crossover junction endodeoxyribonuclease RuvC [Planctomycetes bacterium ADurb.Bin412]
MMKVIGVDPGLQVSGYAVVEQNRDEVKIIDAGVIRADTRLTLGKRLRQIYQDILAILQENQPELMAVEELYAHYKHPRTAILMGHARGMFLLAAAEQGIEVLDFAATRVKKSITGQGRASKEQIQRAVTSQLRLARIPRPADLADALAIALCCLNEKNREAIVS